MKQPDFPQCNGVAMTLERFLSLPPSGGDMIRLSADGASLTDAADWEALDRALNDAFLRYESVQLALATAPGYPGSEEEHLFRDPAPREAFASLWNAIARRYAEHGDKLSFTPLECPREQWTRLPYLGPAEHAAVMRPAVDAIRQADQRRLIVLDGLDGGEQPPTDLFDLPRTGLCMALSAKRCLDRGWDDKRLALHLDMCAAYAQAANQSVLCLLTSASGEAEEAWMTRVIPMLRARGIDRVLRRLL